MRFIVECTAPEEYGQPYDYGTYSQDDDHVYEYDGESVASLACDGGLVPGYWCEGCPFAEEYTEDIWV